MNSRLFRSASSIAALLVSLSLSATAAETIDETVLALSNLEKSVASNQLDQAEGQLRALQKRIPNDTRLEQAQRTISAAYVHQGESALQGGNLGAAEQALNKAKAVMPAANKQADTLAAAIQTSKQDQQAAALAAEQAAKAKARAEAEAAQARQQQQAAERKAAEAKKAQQAAAAAQPKPPVAKLIDPLAASSKVAMPMLDTQDINDLRTLLDQVATEVVAFNCAVKIEVRQSKDYPRVASLLSARVKKIDPAFDLQLEELIAPKNDPQLVLSPRG